ncbi:hypothetical protein HanIR_Chr08g0385191 [Helianthus annuus]|nr:hypothetical protein HanIR_Chr08g0385191 [Helianthus annuus]
MSESNHRTLTGPEPRRSANHHHLLSCFSLSSLCSSPPPPWWRFRCLPYPPPSYTRRREVRGGR